MYTIHIILIHYTIYVNYEYTLHLYTILYYSTTHTTHIYVLYYTTLYIIHVYNICICYTLYMYTRLFHRYLRVYMGDIWDIIRHIL